VLDADPLAVERVLAPATSPAANTSGAPARRCSSTKIPSPMASPARAASRVRGCTPIPTKAKSH
jgi:hypothetical protein